MEKDLHKHQLKKKKNKEPEKDYQSNTTLEDKSKERWYQGHQEDKF